MSKTHLMLGVAVALGAFAGVVVAALLIKQQVAAGVEASPIGTVTGALERIGL